MAKHTNSCYTFKSWKHDKDLTVSKVGPNPGLLRMQAATGVGVAGRLS
jgi:hypothetical protein